MPWNWNVNEIGPRMDVYNGGSRGSVKESKVAAAWPEYEADYLKTRLRVGQGKWDASNLNDAQQAVYLQEVAKNHQDEADECLKRDFKLWLEGRHPTYNDASRVFNNEGRDGLPERRHVYRTSDDANAVTTPMDNWRSTPWGTDQLTHLPGVRDFLRDEFEHGEEQTLYMNLLAEHGPQTLEEAWMYFKHWVAERPLSEAQCLKSNDELGNKALFGSMPHHMQNGAARTRAPAPSSRPRFTGSGVSGTSAPTPPNVKTEYTFTAPPRRTKRAAETVAEGDGNTSQERVGEIGADAPLDEVAAAASMPLPVDVDDGLDDSWVRPMIHGSIEGRAMPVWKKQQEFDFAYGLKQPKDSRYREVKTTNTSTRLQSRMLPIEAAKAQARRTERRALVRSAVEFREKQAAAAKRYAEEEPRAAAASGFTKIVDRNEELEAQMRAAQQAEGGIGEQLLRGGKARRAYAPDTPKEAKDLATIYPAEYEEPDTSAFKE